MTQADPETDCNHLTKVKVRSGGSLVKVKPLFTYDSKYLLVASGCDIKVFSVSSGECILVFKGHEHPVISVQPNRKNKLQVLSCSEEGTVIKWDYSDGKPLKKFDLKLNGKAAAFACPTENGPWFLLAKTDEFDQYRLYSMVVRAGRPAKTTMLIKPVHPAENAVAFHRSGTFVAGIYEQSLIMYDMEKECSKVHKVGERTLTCVACHPYDPWVATGDDHGRIIVWSGMLESGRPIKSIYHWHSSSLHDLVFSAEGAHIYSGGNEGALAKWNLAQDSKRIVPRLGLPITRLAVSPDNVYIVTAHTDNSLQILNSQNVVVQLIQGISKGYCQSSPMAEVAPTGLLYDVRTECLVLNGRPGHLQFYNIREDKQLFQLDIVGRNFISQERHYAIYNTDVEKAAVHSSGMWLATIECRDDGETSLEMRLKFWQYEIETQKFTLNTNVLLPHNKKVMCLKFRPEVSLKESEENSIPLAVTTSADERFKIWTLNADEKDRLSWSCELMGYYKDLPAGDACFSEDGSLLAVVFNFLITLWDPETNILKATFSNSVDSSSIRQVLFGRGRCSHILVCRSEKMLTAWNVITLSALWTVNCVVDCLADDPISDVMASFTSDGNVFIFRPDHPKPLTVVKNVTDTPIISAIFIPRYNLSSQEKNKYSHCWQCNSRLYFLNKAQLLLTLYDENEEPALENSENVVLKSVQQVTPFGMLQAEHIVSDVKPIKPEMHILHEVTKDENELPCPTHVNTVSLAESVISSLLQPYLKKSSMPDQNAYSVPEIDPVDETQSEIPQVNKNDKSVEPMDISEAVPVHIKDFSFLLEYIT